MPKPAIIRPDFSEVNLHEFWRCTSLPGAGGCMVWTGGRHKNGQAVFSWAGHRTSAQRFVYTWAHGIIPTNKRIKTTCRNNLCVSPQHVRIWENGWADYCPTGHPLHGKSECSICTSQRYLRRKSREQEVFAKRMKNDVSAVPDHYMRVIDSQSSPGPQGCILWTGAVTSEGYGYLRYGGRSIMVRRIVWTYYRGALNDSLKVTTLCRNKLCINPEHLRTTKR